MSRENIELVERALRALTERPKPDFATINTLYDPEHVFVSVQANMLGEAEAKGARGFKTWLEEQAGVVPFEMELDGAVDVGADVVLAVTAVRFEGVSSGVKTEQRVWNVVTVRNGKIMRTEAYTDPGEALEAVRPSTGSTAR